jgi:tetratricopeptide (TPR) repeat protein
MKSRHSKKPKNLSKKKKFFKKSPPEVTKKRISPSISRFIPESKPTSSKRREEEAKKSEENPIKQFVWNKYFLVSFVSVFISVGIALQGVELMQHLHQLQIIRNEREQVRGEIAYWEGVVKAHDNYRDGFFKLALLEYRLGNRGKAREYLNKTLFIDPNYEAALEFQQKIEGK